MIMRNHSLAASALLASALLTGACSSTPPEVDAIIRLVDYGIIAPQQVTAGQLDFRVFVDGVAHHTLTFCGADKIGSCDDDPIDLTYTKKPTDARDPSVIPDVTSAIVLGQGWNADLTTVLEAGTYRLYCSIVNHASFGMDRILTVVPA
jgi:hypothetical protein